MTVIVIVYCFLEGTLNLLLSRFGLDLGDLGRQRGDRSGVFSSFMAKKIMLPRKPPMALVAGKRTRRRMCHDVRSQVERPREAALANRTHMDIGNLGDHLGVKEVLNILLLWVVNNSRSRLLALMLVMLLLVLM